jgi:hypothetical protein
MERWQRRPSTASYRALDDQRAARVKSPLAAVPDHVKFRAGCPAPYEAALT